MPGEGEGHKIYYAGERCPDCVEPERGLVPYGQKCSGPAEVLGKLMCIRSIDEATKLKPGWKRILQSPYWDDD